MDNRTAFFGLIVVVLAVIAFLIAAPLLQYILGAALLAFILYPVHTWSVRTLPHVGPRLSASILTLLAVGITVVPLLLLTIIIFDTVVSYLDQFSPQEVVTAIEAVRNLIAQVFGVEPASIVGLETWFIEEISQYASEIVQRLLNEVVGLLNTTIRTSVGVVLLLFLLYYFLIDGPMFLQWVRAVAPVDTSILDELLDEISTVTWAVIGSHLLVAVVEGILGGIGLFVVGFPNAAFWAMVMIILSVLPLIGVWLVWAPVVGYLFVIGNLSGAIFLLVYGLTLLSVVDNYVRAIFVDRGSGLHPVVVLIGVLGGIYLLGVLGLFLGPILLAVFKASIAVFIRMQDNPLPG